MDLFEFETEEKMSREDAAARLRDLADQLERHNEVEARLGTAKVRVKVPDEVTLEFEVEIEDDGAEIEVSISW